MTTAQEATFSELVGFRIVEASKARVVGELHATYRHTTGRGRVHGGCLMAFGDSLGAIGATMNMPRDYFTSTIESKTNFLRAATPGKLQGTATPLHVGKATQVWRTDINDANGRMVATTTQTQIVMTRRPTLNQAAGSAEECANARIEPQQGGSIPEQRRRQIFEAASIVFGRKGFANASVREIAETAGMPVPTMYQYFRSKEDILSLVFDTYMAEMGGSVQAATGTKQGVVDRLTGAISANLAMHDKYRHQIRLMYQETRSLGPENRSRALNITRAANQIWSELIREGNASGEFNVSSPDVVANFLPMLSAAWVLRRWNMDGAPLSAVDDALKNFVLYGMTGPPEARKRRMPVRPASRAQEKLRQRA